jgi:lipid-A-disaccharide synthase
MTPVPASDAAESAGGPAHVLFVAGEASGDQRGARLFEELRREVPGLAAYGLAGEALAAAGCEVLAESREIAVVGLVEVIKILPRARAIFRQILDEVERRGTRTAILIDSPDFNLRLARQLKKRGLKVIYYVSPQVWAWRKGRVKQICRDVDLMLVLFPFEVDFYRQHGLDAVHVGHPLVDEVPVLPSAWDTRPLLGRTDKATIALLPGSRRSEVKSLLPGMLAALAELAKAGPPPARPVEARLMVAPSLDEGLLRQLVGAAGLPPGVELSYVRGEDRFAAIADSHLALCASGTATLEVGLLGTPMIVLYKLKTVSYWLARWLVDLPHFCIVNLVLGERVVPELLQGETAPEKVAHLAGGLLADPAAIAALRANLARLRPALGEAGASRRAAAAVAERWRAWRLL